MDRGQGERTVGSETGRWAGRGPTGEHVVSEWAVYRLICSPLSVGIRVCLKRRVA